MGTIFWRASEVSETLAGTTKLKIGYVYVCICRTYVYVGRTYVTLSFDPDDPRSSSDTTEFVSFDDPRLKHFKSYQCTIFIPKLSDTQSEV